MYSEIDRYKAQCTPRKLSLSNDGIRHSKVISISNIQEVKTCGTG